VHSRAETPSWTTPDYLVVGHLARDVVPGGFAVGGTVAYAGLTAAAHGLQTAIVTSASAAVIPEAALPGVAVHTVPAEVDTVFHNRYLPDGRRQHLLGRAALLGAADVPAAWRKAPLVHLAPIAAELDLALADSFGDSLLCLTPQGWHRSWGAQGEVMVGPWEGASVVLPKAAAVVVSDEDLPDAETLVLYRRLCRLLVVTQGQAGCTVFWQGEERSFPAPKVEPASLTGAGDVFAAAFFIWLSRAGGDAWSAARYANRIAAASVTELDLTTKIRRIAQMTATAGV
jgi:hypothetical protein